MFKELKKLRKKIDELDKELLNIMRKRFQVTKKIGLYKAKNNLPIQDLEREKILFNQKIKMGREMGLNEELITKIFRIIIKEVKRNHRRIQKGI